jgi:hypothetical protein
MTTLEPVVPDKSNLVTAAGVLTTMLGVAYALLGSELIRGGSRLG